MTNIFRRETGKPMIYSLASAERFLDSCKDFMFYIHEHRAWYEIHNKTIYCYDQDRIWGCVQFELWRTNHRKTCIAWLYKNRKFINRRFR